MKRLLSLAVAVTALLSQATTITWTRELSAPLTPSARQVAACADGRIYVIETASTGLARIRLLNGASPGLLTGSAGLNDSIFCAGNKLFHFNDASGLLRVNDGSERGALGNAKFIPGNPERMSGGMVLALFIPVTTFVRKDADGNVFTATNYETIDQPSSWKHVGDAGGAEQLALGGGFLEYRVYAQNFDDSLWENAGQGCSAYWRKIREGGASTNPTTIRASTSDGINKLVVLDNSGAVYRGTINHEERDIVIDAADFARINTVVAGSRLRAHGAAATFTPSPALAFLGVSSEVIPLTPASISTFLGNTTYTPNEINLSSFTLVPSARTVLINASFEEAGIELLTSNGLFPNLNISSLNGQVTLTGRVGRCGQPEINATAATFNGNFHGVDNLFSFVVDLMNGDIKARVQAEMLAGAQSALADPATQLALQGMLIDAATFETGGPRWSHIVGNSFSISGSTVRFTVER